MSIGQRSGWMLLALVAVMIAAAPCVAADRVRAARPTGENVELFAAMKSGQIEVQANPTKDESELTVRIINKTDKPLSVRLPDAFAARQILAQMGGRGGGMGGMGGMGGGGMGGMGGGGMGGMGGGGGGQSMGGGMGGGMMGGMGGGGMGMGGGGGMGMGMGMMNVAPEKVAKFRVPTVCLEHGKPTPRTGMKYQIVPVEQVSSKPAVEEVCRMLGTGKVSQRAVQAAAWHLNSNMSWEQLARKDIKSVSGNRPYFTADEINAAMELTTVAVNTVEQKRKAAPTEPKKYSAGQTVSQD